jgi:hypothetical protein
MTVMQGGGCGGKWFSDMDGSWKYTKKAVTESEKGVVLNLEDWVRGGGG